MFVNTNLEYSILLIKSIEKKVLSIRRINKRGEETIIYQAATYTTKPAQYFAIYKKRWPIEKMFKTDK